MPAPADDAESFSAPARRAAAGRIVTRTRLLLWIATAVYFALLLPFCVALHWWAERDMILAFCSFLPATLWILPAAALATISLPFSPRLFLLQCLGAAVYVWIFMDYGTPAAPRPAPSDRVLTVLSYNRGQHRGHSIEPFKDAVLPDIVVLQESFGRARLYADDPRFGEYPHVRGDSEFVVLSKFPIKGVRYLTYPALGEKINISVRFEIDFNGTPVALYAVHMPTLREVLGRYRSGALLYGIIGLPFTPWHEARKAQEDYWEQRTRLGRTLAEAAAADELPAILAGDFNTPDHGAIYHAFASRFTDAHEERGCGFGYTFPGTGESFPTGHRPWLRLDYVFSSRAWETLRFTTEPAGASQHRAIAATLGLLAQHGGSNVGANVAKESGRSEDGHAAKDRTGPVGTFAWGASGSAPR